MLTGGGVERWTGRLLHGVLLAACAAGALTGVPAAQRAWVAVGAFAAALLAFGAARAARGFDAAGPALLVLFSAAVLAWALAVDSHQTSDFGVYFRCGSEFVPSPWSLQEWAAACESKWLPGFSAYWRRALVYSLPLEWLAGGSYLGLKVLHALAHITAVVLVYIVCSRALGRSAAAVAALLLAIHPEFWFATTIATPDNLFPLAFVALLAALARVAARGASWPAVLLMFACVAFLDLLRSVGPILVVGIFLFALACDARRATLLAVAAVSGAIVLALGALPAALGLSTAQSNDLLAMLVGNGASHAHAFTDAYGWHQYVLPQIPPGQRHEVALGLIAQDLRDAPLAPLHWASKAATLFEGQGYYFFAGAGPLGSPDDALLQGGQPTISFNPALAPVFRGVIVAAGLLALAGSLRASSSGLVRACLSLTAAFLLYVALVGEVQSRYSLLFAPALCILAGAAWTPGAAGQRWPWAESLLSAGAVLVGACLLVAMLTAWARAELRGTGSLAWSAATPGGECAAALRVEAHHVHFADPQGKCTSVKARGREVRGPLRFFVVRQPVPPRWDTRLQEVLTVQWQALHSDGSRTAATQTLGPSEVAMPVSVPGRGGISELTVTIHGASGAGGNATIGYLFDDRDALRNLPHP